MSVRAAILSLFCAVVVLTDRAAATQPQPAAPRLVAVGDIHGAGLQLAQILQAAGLIDANRKWTGGTARLVQTADFLDRGADIRGVMDLLMRLEGEARAAGGRVDVLFGNHEGMNVLHDFRDVSPDAFAAFADAKSDERLKKAFDRHAAIARRNGTPLDRTEWMKAHPRGYPEYVDALGPTGQYGKWIRGHKTVLQVGDTIFMHAGLHPDRVVAIEDVNRTVEQEVKNWDDLVAAFDRAKVASPYFTLPEFVAAAQVEIGKIGIAQKTGEPLEEYVTPEFLKRLQFFLNIDKLALIDANGPLWYRGLAMNPEDQQPAVDALLRRYSARRIVLGHTPQRPGRIRTRFNGAVVLIDTGMLTSYFNEGQPSALEIQDGRLTAIYLTGREPLTGANAATR